MRVVKILCNRCKKEIKGYPVALIPVFTDRGTGDEIPDDAGRAPQEKEQEGKDYCLSCTEKIISFANNMVEDMKTAADDNGSGKNSKMEKPKEETEDGGKIQQPDKQSGVTSMKSYTAYIPKVQAKAKMEETATVDTASVARKDVEAVIGQDKSEVDKPKRRTIDVGKILALKNAGWSSKDIAGEMNVEVQAVYDCLYRHRKKQESEEQLTK